jgi:hypothetical protein
VTVLNAVMRSVCAWLAVAPPAWVVPETTRAESR